MSEPYTTLDHPRQPLTGYPILILGVLMSCVGWVYLLYGILSNSIGAYTNFFPNNEWFPKELSPETEFRIPFAATLVVQMFLIGGGIALIKNGRRRLALPANSLLQKDLRPPVLLLRAFADDNLVVHHAKKGNSFFPQDVTLEEAISPVLSDIGPVIAIGRPGESLAPLGASRDYVSHDTWTDAVQHWLSRCSRVVMIMGNLSRQDGLAWELRKIREFGFLHKLVLVMPLQNADSARQRWQEFSDVLEVPLPEFTGVEIFVTFDEHALPSVKQAKMGFNPAITYRESLREYFAAIV